VLAEPNSQQSKVDYDPIEVFRLGDHPAAISEDNIAVAITTTFEVLRDIPDGAAMHVLHYVFSSLNWSDLADDSRGRKSSPQRVMGSSIGLSWQIS
jgi:hypothetical protein